MRRIMLTIDDPADGEKDYCTCDTIFTEPELEEKIKTILVEEAEAEGGRVPCYRITEILENKGYIKIKHIPNYWIEIDRR